MPLTRDERQILETIIKKLGKLESRISRVEDTITILSKRVIGGGGSSFLDLTDEEKEAVLTDTVKKIIKDNLPVHDHTSSSKGGDAFAKKGANLID